MQTTTTTEQTTTYRNPANLHISTHSIRISDGYGEQSRDVVEIIPEGDEIMGQLVRLVSSLRDSAEGSYKSPLAVERLQRLAGAMGLEYSVSTEEA